MAFKLKSGNDSSFKRMNSLDSPVKLDSWKKAKKWGGRVFKKVLIPLTIAEGVYNIATDDSDDSFLQKVGKETYNQTVGFVNEVGHDLSGGAIPVINNPIGTSNDDDE